MDGDYLFNINQRVINNSDDSIILNNASKIKRKTAPALSGMFILHEGLLGVLEEQLELIDYDELKDDGETFEWEMKSQTGKLILFDSSIEHSVPENKSKENRISIAFNLFSLPIKIGSVNSVYSSNKFYS